MRSKRKIILEAFEQGLDVPQTLARLEAEGHEAKPSYVYAIRSQARRKQRAAAAKQQPKAALAPVPPAPEEAPSSVPEEWHPAEEHMRDGRGAALRVLRYLERRRYKKEELEWLHRLFQLLDETFP